MSGVVERHIYSYTEIFPIMTKILLLTFWSFSAGQLFAQDTSGFIKKKLYIHKEVDAKYHLSFVITTKETLCCKKKVPSDTFFFMEVVKGQQ